MENSNTPKDFKGRLSQLVHERDMDYRPLAAAIGISQASLSKYTRGDAEPGLGALIKLAKYFNVSIDYLAGLTDVRSPDMDFRGAVEFTGLSELTLAALLDYGRHDNTFMLISMIIYHPSFHALLAHIASARECNEQHYQSRYKDISDPTDSNERLISEVLRIGDDALYLYGYSLVSLEDMACLEERNAEIRMREIVSDLCSLKVQPFNRDRDNRYRKIINENSGWRILVACKEERE